MLKGNDAYKTALNLLGYLNTDDRISPDGEMYKRAVCVINQILIDLKQDKIGGLYDEISITPQAAEALPYGVAMLFALINGDSNKNSLFTEIYNSKRAAALCEIDKITDKMPNVVLGEI